MIKPLAALAVSVSIVLSGCCDSRLSDSPATQQATQEATQEATAAPSIMTDAQTLADSIDDALDSRTPGETKDEAISRGIDNSGVEARGGGFTWVSTKGDGYLVCIQARDNGLWASYDSLTGHVLAGNYGEKCPGA